MFRTNCNTFYNINKKELPLQVRNHSEEQTIYNKYRLELN